MTARLILAPCSHFAAKQAVGRWHYSKRLPSSRFRFGAWESDRFIGCVLFGPGAAPANGSEFGLDSDATCELRRVALCPQSERRSPTSRVVAISLRLLRRHWAGLRLVVSYADPQRGHRGGIYQATGWVYLGQSEGSGGDWLRLHGKVVHPKSVYDAHGTRSLEWLRERIDPAASRVPMPAKHKYAYPMDDAMRAQLAPLARPYPRAGSIGADAPSDQLGEDDSQSIPALQIDLLDGAA